MEPIFVDCDVYNANTVEKIEVSEEQWKTMQAAIGKRAKKERKLYPSDHDEIHPVGYNWANLDKWKARKSGASSRRSGKSGIRLERLNN